MGVSEVGRGVFSEREGMLVERFQGMQRVKGMRLYKVVEIEIELEVEDIACTKTAFPEMEMKLS